jgi:hypothetical protein
VEALVRDAPSRGRKHGLEHVDLKLANGCLGEIVFALHNAHYSLEWIAAYLSTRTIMSSCRMFVCWGSLEREVASIFSTNHREDSPSWIQFGEFIFIYPDLPSAAEQGFLKIQSYIINLH